MLESIDKESQESLIVKDGVLYWHYIQPDSSLQSPTGRDGGVTYRPMSSSATFVANTIIDLDRNRDNSSELWPVM